MTGVGPRPDRPHRPATVRSESDVHGFVARTFFKIGPPGTVGIESEWFVVDDDHPGDAVPVERVRRLLAGGEVLPAAGIVTFEPGGQVELSTAPAAGIAAAVTGLAADLGVVAGRLAGSGLRLVAAGTDPLRRPARQLDEQRYAAMEAYFDTQGPAGRAMMTTTTAVQVCLDAGAGPADVRRRWWLANALTPLLVAAFANSPLHGGRPTGYRSARTAIWQRIDPTRTRSPQGEDPVEAYARYALDARVMVVRREAGGWLADPGVTFREWVCGGLPRPPTEDDLGYHLTTLFPPVRAREWLELRAIDALPPPWWQVAVGVCAALLDHPAASATATTVVDRLGWADLAAPGRGNGAARWSGSGPPDRALALDRAARLGMADPGLRRAASSCLAAAAAALRRTPQTAGLAGCVEAYAERFVERGRTPADDVLDAFRAGVPPWRAVQAAGEPAPPIRQQEETHD